jgi:hypothetical protein
MKDFVIHCLPGEGEGDESWFFGLNEFEQQETLRQVAFKRGFLQIEEDGVWSKKPSYKYPHILPENQIKKAFFHPIAETVISYLNDKNIALHSEALNLRSSQVCCLNVLFHLKQDKELAKGSLDPLLPNVQEIKDIEFEYTGPEAATEWLGEPPGGKRGQNRTSIDAAIFWEDISGKSRLTLLEWKYTERSFGSCGGYESDSNKQKALCRMLNVADAYPQKDCFLTGGKPQTSRCYWEHLSEAGIDRTGFKNVEGCPFRGPFYQILRQSLLAVYLQKNLKSVDSVDIATLHFKNNKSLLNCPANLQPLLKSKNGSVIDAWNSVLIDGRKIRAVTIEKIMERTDGVLKKDDSWRIYIKARYGV